MGYSDILEHAADRMSDEEWEQLIADATSHWRYKIELYSLVLSFFVLLPAATYVAGMTLLSRPLLPVSNVWVGLAAIGVLVIGTRVASRLGARLRIIDRAIVAELERRGLT